MKLIIIYLLTLITFVLGTGEFLILHSPDSIKFRGNSKIDQNLLKEVLSASLGYTVEKNSNWDGMYITDPFSLPRAVVHVAIEGIPTIGKFVSNEPIHQFPMNTDEDEFSTWSSMKYRIESRHPEGNNTIVRIELANDIPLLNYSSSSSDNSLQNDVEEDRRLLEEVAMLKAISQRIKTQQINSDNINQDLYWIVLDSLHAVRDFHGPESKATEEADNLVRQALQQLQLDMIDAFNGQVLVTAAVSDASHTRRSRSLLQDAAGNDKEPTEAPKTVATPSPNPNDVSEWNLAADYDENYPVIFNIILWFGVALLFSLIAISYVIGTMDPGRDSIIYRMTSNRMKKDN